MPGQPSDEKWMNPYNAPRDTDAGDTTAYLSAEREMAKAIRNGDPRKSGKNRQAAPPVVNILAGNEVRDKRGKPVGTVEAVEADGAVVLTPAGKVKVPLDAFGQNAKGLLIGITKSEFDALVAAATSTPGS